MIGIIGAMDMEVESLQQAMTEKCEEEISGMRFHRGRLNGKECVAAKCFVGKVNAAVCAQTMILRYRPSVIVNTGVAGGIGPNVKIGDLVIATSCVEHDMDSTALGDPPAYLSGLDLIYLPCDEKSSALVEEEARRIYRGQVLRGVIATGDQFVADPEKCGSLNRQFGALACEMECASIAHVCCLNHIPFVGVRSISDNANDSGKVDFLTFARESAAKAAALLAAAAAKL